MDKHKFFVEKLRFHLKEKDTLVFVGWFFDGSTKDHSLEAYMDGEKLPMELQINRGAQVRQKYIRSINQIDEEVVGIVTLPPDWRERGVFRLRAFYREQETKAYRIRRAGLLRLEQEISYYVESCRRSAGRVTVSGWCMADGEVKLDLLNAARQPISEKVEHYCRKDLLSVFPEYDGEGKPGFSISAKVGEREAGPFFLEMRNASRMSRTRLYKWENGTRGQYLLEKAGDAARYFRRNGLSATVYKVQSKLLKKDANTYENWRKKYAVTPEELAAQREQRFSKEVCFSIVVPLYQTVPAYLREMIESVLAQTYGNWQLCLADGSPHTGGQGAAGEKGTPRTALTGILEEYAARDSRICFVTMQENEGISGNTNAALALAHGDYLVLVDHDDLVAPNALYEFAAAIAHNGEIDMLYSDEDKVDMEGKRYFEPHFKPDFNPDLLRSMNYICHLLAVRTDVAARAGGFRSEFDGAQDYDFILRCSECAAQIYHVPKILYHWRCHMESTAANPESKRYAFEAGRRAIEAHYERLSLPARVENTEVYGRYRTRYAWEEQPLVSVIIPNKDHADDLSQCIASIQEKSDYRNFELVIVENNSTDEETFSYYQKLQREYENVRVVYYEGGFNYAKINNFGVQEAAGEYLLLLNNDTEMIDGEVIGELLGYCMREDVGAVGAKLLYGDDTIQHAGVVLGFGGTAGHAFIGKHRYDAGYFGRILCAQDYSAVTAACMMTKRSVYEAVGGMTEELAVAFNDIDYCLKVRALGKLVVYDPYAELYHYESKSRGLEDSPEKVERFLGETERLLSFWREQIEDGDPYYNRNLTLDNSDFSLRR